MNLVARDFMIHPVVCAREDTTVKALMTILGEKKITGVPVIGADDRLVGVVSVTDLLSHGGFSGLEEEIGDSHFHSSPAMDGMAEAHDLFEPDGEVLDHPVTDFMSRSVITASEHDPIGKIADTMVSRRIHRVIIVEEEKVTGIISTMDILKALRNAYLQSK